MTWDGIVTNYHQKYIKQLEVTPTIEAYIQSIVFKKTLSLYLLNTVGKLKMV